jgi:hypothetical protein
MFAPALAAFRTRSIAFEVFSEIDPGVVIWTKAKWTVLETFDMQAP